jgi:hypothetical protein
MSCICTGGMMLVRGVPTCATCNKPVSQPSAAASVEVSTERLPTDLSDDERGRDAFNRACRTGRVNGARKIGRNWVAPLDAWNSRSPAQRPRGLAGKQTKGGRVVPLRSNDDAVLAELGLGTRRAG